LILTGNRQQLTDNGNNMQIAKVIGRSVITKKKEGLEGNRILLVQPVDFELNENGTPFLAFDVVDAGAGEIVMVARGGEAMVVFEKPYPPIDKTCVAVVDQINYYPDA